MALGTKRNILVGAASVFIGPSNVATPTDVTRATWVNGTPPTGWRSVGYTQDGFEVSTDPSFGEVEVDQLLDAPVVFKDGMGFSVSTTFAEATLQNLLVAWGQADSTLVSTASAQTITIKGGSLGESPIERGLIAIGNAPKANDSSAYRERVYHIFSVASVEGSGHTMARAEGTVIPITFRAMPNDNGDYGIIRDTLT